MKKKRSEESLRTMMKYHSIKAIKGRDRGYINCPNCHTPAKTCPNCKGDMLLNKAATRLDFLVLINWTEVECKQGDESWALNDFTATQEKLLPQEIEELGEPRWLFLEIGDGRAPKGKEAYLIPADEFIRIRDLEYEAGRKSVRFRKTNRSKVKEARELFERFGLTWKTKVGWTIPEDHEFWKVKVNPVDLAAEIEVKLLEAEEQDEPGGEQEFASTPARLDVLG